MGITFLGVTTKFSVKLRNLALLPVEFSWDVEGRKVPMQQVSERPRCMLLLHARTLVNVCACAYVCTCAATLLAPVACLLHSTLLRHVKKEPWARMDQRAAWGSSSVACALLLLMQSGSLAKLWARYGFGFQSKAQ